MLQIQTFSLSNCVRVGLLNPFLLTKNVARIQRLSKIQIKYLSTGSSNRSTCTGNEDGEKIRKMDISSIVAKIVQQASKFDVMLSSVPHSTVSEKVELLLSLDAKPNDIVNLLVKKRDLLQSETLSSFSSELQSYGVKNKTILQIIVKTYDFHNMNSEKVITTFECLRTMGMTNDEIVHIFNYNPNIVNFSVKQLNTRLLQLRELFTVEHSLRLMKTMPSTITEKMEDINEKFMYVHQTMGISQRQMISASLFRHSLTHVMTRHLFLERAGLFKKTKKKELSTNPMLKDIIDTSDTTFVKLLTYISVEEYQTFCKLLEKENDVSYFEMESKPDSNDQDNY